MSKAQIEKTATEKFLEALNGTEWAETTELVEMLNQVPGFWENIMIMEAVHTDWKKRFVRKKIKQLKMNGFPLFASIETKNGEGETIRVYKREDTFNADDFQKAAEYHGNTTIYHAKMAKHYAAGYKEMTGKQIPLPFAENAFIDD